MILLMFVILVCRHSTVCDIQNKFIIGGNNRLLVYQINALFML